MNDIDNMPSKCQSCPYWEACEYPHICDDMKPKQNENGNLNAEFAKNPQDRLTDELIRKQDALDAIHCDITVTGRQNAELVAATIGAFADRIKALPPVQPETATVTIGRTRGETTMWYECDACGEPVDVNDNYCRNCGRKLIHD